MTLERQVSGPASLLVGRRVDAASSIRRQKCRSSRLVNGDAWPGLEAGCVFCRHDMVRKVGWYRLDMWMERLFKRCSFMLKSR